MVSGSIAPIATLRLSSPSHILLSSCCPDKDLAVFISRHGDRDTISLWKLQGSKKWETDLDGEGVSDEVADLAWSPDGQTIAIAHTPPRITLHSIQDGSVEHSFPIENLSKALLGVWWFMDERKSEDHAPVPDIFKRDGNITGASQSLLKMLPLLDPLKDDIQPLTATDLFPFQGNQSRSETQSQLPDIIACWPILPSSLSLASIQPSKIDTGRPGQELDEVDKANTNSILVVADDSGYLHYFLDGVYPLGYSSIGDDLSVISLSWDQYASAFFVHGQKIIDVGSVTRLRPTVVELPLLKTRYPRDVAIASSAVREFVWYTTCVIREMREAWFGSNTHIGARELGPRWVRALEARQKDQFGQDDPNAIIDLTTLLVTGKASDALLDFLGSGEQMSDRGIQKWESTVVDCLAKLRDFSERRLAPACQRLILVLEEARGWSALPRYFAAFGFTTSDVEAAIDLTARAIVISAWLAAAARREARRFKEFIGWIRYESGHINHSGETVPRAPRHDFLEVNNYLVSGLVVSPIDKWFMGQVPKFPVKDLGVAPGTHDLIDVVARARRVIEDPEQMAWQQSMKFKDLSHLDRNLESLLQDLTVRCSRLFYPAAYATGQSAIISHGSNALSTQPTRSTLPKILTMRERTFKHKDQNGGFVEYLAILAPSIADSSFLWLARTCYKHDVANTPLRVDVAMLECRGPGESESQEESAMRGTLLDFDFFDETDLVVVYRSATSRAAFIAAVNYSEVDYQDLKPDGYVSAPSREDLMINALQLWRDRQLHSVPLPIRRCRELVGCRRGGVSLALNGRVGRRVACVLDDSGTTVEVMDMEGESEETEEADATSGQ